MNEGRYYISTGALNCFYTLRYTFLEAWGETVVERDYHVCNLSTVREVAITKAKTRTGADLSASFDLNRIDRRDNVDWSILQGGKYEGHSIHEVRELPGGQEYLVWLVENCAKNRSYAKTVELLQSLLASELAVRADDRAAEKSAKDAKQVAYAERVQEIAEVLRTQKGDFCESLATDLGYGIAPRGRALDIVCDIFAKSHGRRNTKAYNEAYEKASGLLAEA